MAAKRKAKSRYADLYFVEFTLAGVLCESRTSSLSREDAERLAEECKHVGSTDAVVVSVARGRLG